MAEPDLFQSEFKDDAALRDAAHRDDRNIGQFTGRSRGPFVVRIKKALNAWAAKQSPAPTPLPLTEDFDGATSLRVELYKRSQTPPILNYANKIDPIVGKKTVRALDAELPAAPRGNVAPIALDVATDVVVRFAGTLGAPREIPEGQLVYPHRNDFHVAHGIRRRLVLLGRFTKSIDADADFLVALGQRIAEEMRGGADARLPNAPRFVAGKVCIHGSSSGGRNAIHLARRLETQHQLAVTYVGLADAAWFMTDGEVGGTPSLFGKTIPEIRLTGVATPSKENKENYFQTHGQRVEVGLRSARVLFTSKMDNKEIHGPINDWNNKPLDDEPKLKTLAASNLNPSKAGDDALHVACSGIATPRIVSRIKTLLEEGGSPPNRVPPVFQG